MLKEKDRRYYYRVEGLHFRFGSSCAVARCVELSSLLVSYITTARSCWWRRDAAVFLPSFFDHFHFVLFRPPSAAAL